MTALLLHFTLVGVAGGVPSTLHLLAADEAVPTRGPALPFEGVPDSNEGIWYRRGVAAGALGGFAGGLAVAQVAFQYPGPNARISPPALVLATSVAAGILGGTGGYLLGGFAARGGPWAKMAIVALFVFDALAAGTATILLLHFNPNLLW